ncbi:MAG: ROK family protein, partial [Roseibacillus sp.]|nr:ROK family protein [Roseibacillus sp.]
AQRLDTKEAAWQLPQGGIDEGEEPKQAALRELEEEIGTANVDILGESRKWLSYDLPPDLVGEAWRGAARDVSDVVLLTLGTGVGGGVLLGGKLFTGHNGAAAEPGLIGVDPEGPPCNSGNSGSLEQFASITGLGRLWDGDPAQLSRLAAAGDQAALAVWERYGRILGVGISSLVYMFTPEVVLVGGGLAGGSVHFLPSLRREVELRVQAVSREGLQIRACALGNSAGRLGAARLALERLAPEHP